MEKESAKHVASLKHLHQFTLKESLAKLNPYPKDSVRYNVQANYPKAGHLH